MRESIFSVAEAANDRELRETGRAMIGGETGFVALKNTSPGKRPGCTMRRSPPSAGPSGWFSPKRRFLRGSKDLNRTIQMSFLPKNFPLPGKYRVRHLCDPGLRERGRRGSLRFLPPRQRSSLLLDRRRLGQRGPGGPLHGGSQDPDEGNGRPGYGPVGGALPASTASCAWKTTR